MAFKRSIAATPSGGNTLAPPVGLEPTTPRLTAACSTIELRRNIQNSDLNNQNFVLALPIFPGRRQPSIVGRNELNYRVRNGNGWTLILISTNYSSVLPKNKLYYTIFSSSVKSYFIPDSQTSEAFADRKGKAAEGTSFRACAEASDPQLALTW